MADENGTSESDFILVGFSDLSHLWVLLFVSFVCIFLMTVIGNIFIMLIIYSNSHLHTPMYFFLTNLSLVDISYTGVIFPKLFANFFLPIMCITFQERLLHVYFFVALLATEICLLTVMAYDRYVAICKPLYYRVGMNQSACIQLTTGAWICGFLDPLAHVVLISKFSFCGSHNINHFFCDLTALLNLSCTSPHTVEIMTFVLGVIIGIFSWVLVVTSYVKIILAILRIQSFSGRCKAFSTCVSHITVVILFYGSLVFVYLRPASTYSLYQSKIFSLMKIAVIPVCNPIIYTLKNQEFKEALKERKEEIYRKKN